MADSSTPAEIAQQLHEVMHKDFSKGDFAATLFERFHGAKLVCPAYIANAVDWLAKELHATGESA